MIQLLITNTGRRPFLWRVFAERCSGITGNICSVHLLYCGFFVCLLLNTWDVSLTHSPPSDTPAMALEVWGVYWCALLRGYLLFLFLFLLCSVYKSREPSFYILERSFGLKLEKRRELKGLIIVHKSPSHHFPFLR